MKIMLIQLQRELCCIIYMEMVLNEESREKIGDKRSQQKKRRCQEKQRWSVENNWKRNWKRIIFSEESKIMIGHDERVYMLRKTGEGL